MIVFIATVQENAKFIDELKAKGYSTLHPFFSFNGEEGKKMCETLGKTPSTYTNRWESILRKDLFCIEQSDVVIYDFDNLPEEGRYLCMAAALQKPIIGVSETLKPAPVYFSGSIIAVIKPKQVIPMLSFSKENSEFLELPKRIEAKGEDDAKLLPNSGMPTELHT